MRKLLIIMVLLAAVVAAGVKMAVIPLPDSIAPHVPDILKPTTKTTSEKGVVTPGVTPTPKIVSPPETVTWDPADTSLGRTWISDGEIQTANELRSGEKSFSGDRRYNHRDMHTFYWRRACDISALKNSDCAQRVLVLARTSFGVSEANDEFSNMIVDRRYFTQDGERATSYSEIDGDGKVERAPDFEGIPRLRIDGNLYGLATTTQQLSTWGSAGIAAITHLKYASMGYHFALMAYDNPQKPGLPGSTYVFAMNPAELEAQGSRNWRAKTSDLFVPWGLDIKQQNGCSSHRSGRLISSATDLADFASTSASVTVANFNVNSSFKSDVSERVEKEQYSLVERVDCVEFIVILDKARATLNNFLVDKVEKAAAVCKSADDASDACIAALDVIIGTYGTHYPNAGLYGGLVTQENTLTNNASKMMNSDGFESGTSFDQELELGVSLTTKTSIGVPGIASGGAEIGISANSRFKSGYNFGTASETTKTELKREENQNWVTKSRGGSGGLKAENWSIAKETSVPIFVDLRPMSELLAPPFFTNEHIVDVVRPALAARIVTLITQGEGPSADRFNKDVYTAPAPKKEKLTPLSMLEFRSADDEISISSTVSRYSITADKAVNIATAYDDLPLIALNNGCAFGNDSEGWPGCAWRVRRFDKNQSDIVFELAVKGGSFDYTFVNGSKQTIEKTIGGKPGLAWDATSKKIYIDNCDAGMRDGMQTYKPACRWSVEPAGIDVNKGGKLAYYVRPASGDSTDQGLYIPRADATKEDGWANPTLATCRSSDANPECLWYISPRFWGNKMVGFTDKCDGGSKTFYATEGDYMVDTLEAKGLVVVVENEKNSQISQIHVPPGYVVRANGGHRFGWGGSETYKSGTHCLKGSVDNFFRSVSVRRETSADKIKLRPN